MNISNDPTNGRMLVRGRGTGGVGREDILRRARELAEIDGSPAAEPSEDQIARAEAELMGLSLPATMVEDEEATGALSRDPSEPLSIPGHESETREGPDEEKAVERLALEGVEEAQHEQMLESRRRERQHSDDVDL
jgi:hypothetical protein